MKSLKKKIIIVTTTVLLFQSLSYVYGMSVDISDGREMITDFGESSDFSDRIKVGNSGRTDELNGNVSPRMNSGTVIGTGVRFRSSPKISSDNIIRTFDYGEIVWFEPSGINCAYADGYNWSYVQAQKDGKWGYIASKYFANNGVCRTN